MISFHRTALAAAMAMAVFTGAARAAGTVTFCSTLTVPPMEFVNAKTQPVGGDVDFGNALAAHIGKTAKWEQVPFAGLLPALLAGHCDAIISQLYVKPARLRVIDMIPYMDSHETVMELAGKSHYERPENLSGLKVASVTGTTAASLISAANAELVKAGKKPADSITFPDNVAALQALQFGQVNAYALTYETASYYMGKTPGQFQMSVTPYGKTVTGIGVRKDEPQLRDAFTKALAKMMKDGSYDAIFKKWSVEADKLQS
jgi:polar amino acid transport system substrate-binding protein